jgi:PAS domain S-box-containing protein
MSVGADSLSFDSLPSPTVTFDENGRVRNCNAAATDLFGVPPAEILGTKLIDHFDTDDSDRVRNVLASALADERPNLADAEVFTTRETGRHVDISWLPPQTESPLGHLLLYDVSDHVRTQRDLRRLHEISSDADRSLEEKIDAMFRIGLERFDLDIAFLSMIDEEFEVVAACGDKDLLSEGSTAPLADTYCRKTLDTEGPMAVENAVEQGWKDDIAFQTYGLGCYIGTTVLVDGSTYGTLCFADTDPREQRFSDADRAIIDVISRWAGYEIERHRREKRLKRQNERLEEFTSLVSHDLRNPLTVASGNLELLAEDIDDKRLDDALDALERQETLIDDMLEVARQGETISDPDLVDLESIVTDAWKAVRMGEATLSVGTLPTVRADKGRLQTLFENLFRNAADHASVDGDELTVTVGSTNEGFYVADSGAGISKDERDDVFTKGYTTDEDGTGLGLALVDRIIQAHGWDVTVGESSDGGARFDIYVGSRI